MATRKRIKAPVFGYVRVRSTVYTVVGKLLGYHDFIVPMDDVYNADPRSLFVQATIMGALVDLPAEPIPKARRRKEKAT